MKIRKPHSIILSKKFPDKYFDYITDQEFPYDQINEHPLWCRLEYDNNGNLIKTIIVSKHNDVINGGRKETTFGNYDNARNPFKKLYLLEEYFYKSLSKNNYKNTIVRSYDENNNITSFSENSWDFSYDSSGNIILAK